MDTLTDYFETLPLNEKEKHVLAVLYERGPIAVSKLALIAKTERTLTYKIVKELERKGYAHPIKMDKGLVYKAQDIETVIFEQERGVEQLRQAERLIEEKRASRPEVTDFVVFEGAEGIHKTLLYGMEDAFNDELLGIYGGTPEQDLHPIFNERHKFYKEHNIRSRIIFPYDDSTARSYLERAKVNGHATECRIAHSDSDSVRQELVRTSLQIFQNNVKYYSYDPKRAIVITDSQAVDMQRLIFEMLWEKAEKIS